MAFRNLIYFDVMFDSCVFLKDLYMYIYIF